jgi:phosphoesterase RecJ-like protein
MTNQFQELNKLIEESSSILITAHEHPDGDAVGALVGLSYILERRKKNWTAYTNDPPPGHFDYLDLSRITTDPSALTSRRYDLVIFLDIGDIKRSRAVETLLGEMRPKTVSIDHHPTRTQHGDAELIDLVIINRQASSTSEILYDFCMEVGEPLTRTIATCLLTGILTDTGTFSNLGTTRASLDVAARLIRRGALIQEVNDRTWKNKTASSLQLWGRVFSRLKQDPDTGIVTAAVFLRDLEECRVDRDSIEGLTNFLNGLDEARAALLLQELPGHFVKGSYRTTAPDMDVSILAAAYGGGGHVKAAGFTAPGDIVETETAWSIVDSAASA